MSSSNHLRKACVLTLLAMASATSVASASEWFSETTESAVYGTRHEAATVRMLEGYPDVSVAISVSCLEDEGEASVKFMVASERGSEDPTFTLGRPSMFGATPVVGSGRTRLTKGVVNAERIVQLTNYSNEVEIFSSPYIPGLSTTFLSTNSMAWNVLENLPIALALETNLGEVEFVLPPDPVVVSVLKKCAKGPQPTAFTSEQYIAELEANDGATAKAKAQAKSQAEAASRPDVATAKAQAAAVAAASRPDRDISIVQSVPPLYPAKEARDGIGGVVVLRLTIAADGALVDAQVERSSGNGSIDRSALDVVKRWKFKGGVKDGEDVGGEITVPMTFRPPR